MHEETPAGAVRLLPSEPQPPLPEPDEAARDVTERVARGENVVVLGAPGTGKSTLAMRLLVDAVEAGKDALILAPTRSRADRARVRAAHLLGAAGGGTVRARTPAGFAFTVLATSLAARPDPLPAPVLLAGAEEDAALAQLLLPDQWPGLPPEAVASRAFRTELRNLLARAGELGLTGEDLARMGKELRVELWGPASALLRTWDAQGRPSAERRSERRRMDSARIQDRAIEALRDWDADGVLEPRPVPDLLIVDDYQDCTAATARLLAALAAPDAAGHRAQVVVLGDPDVAVETFRGGSPSLLSEAEDRSGLAATRLRLIRRHRGNPALETVWRDQADRIPVTGTARHRHPEPQGPGIAARGGHAGVEPLIASSPAQETAHVARILRAEHVLGGTPWEEMAVIVRSAGRAQAVGRDLRRRGVPLAATTPAVLLRAEPAASSLLAVARAAIEGRFGGAESLPERSSALDLLQGPLVGLSILDLRRLRRRLRLDRPEEASPDENLLSVLGSVEGARALAAQLADEPLAEQAERLARAAAVMAAARGVVEGAEGRVDAERLLWEPWAASGRAEAWRTLALAPGTRGSHGDTLLAEAAEHDLDVVTALFKRAEVWAERHPGAHARAFLDELAEEVLPSDSVAPHGVRPGGVSVLTPAAAAGQEWELVAVMGVERDAWPDLRLRDTLTRAGLLVDAATGRLPIGADGVIGTIDPATARGHVRADERRMLLAAMTRATRRLIVTSVQDADHAPSPFLLEVARACSTPIIDEDGSVVVAPDTGDLTLRGLVAELRRAAQGTDQPDRAEHAQGLLAALAVSGVDAADPGTWAGLSTMTSAAPLSAPGQPVRVSPSDVDRITQCPLRWFLERQGGGSGPSDAQTLGTIIHAIAETAQRDHLNEDAIRALLEQRLPELAYPDTWLGQNQVAGARAIVEHLITYLEDTPGRVDVEKRVDALLELPVPAPRAAAADAPRPTTVAVRIAGRIDRIEHQEPGPDGPPAELADDALPEGNGARVRITDIKTGKRPAADATRNAQLATYRMALEAHGYVVTGAALIPLREDPYKDGTLKIAPPKAALAPSPDEESQEDWAAVLVASAALDASGARLEARTGEHCRHCAVRAACPAQTEGRMVVA